MYSRSSLSLIPQGFQYLPDWITSAAEQHLLAHIEKLSFSEVRMHGIVAKSRCGVIA
jgi:hypothetical protein